MKTKISFFVLFFGIVVSGYAAGERTPAGGRSLAMGGTSVALYDLWSLNNNQAGVVWLKGTNAGLAFQNQFLVKELMYQQLGLAISSKAGTAGLFMSRFCNAQYNEMKAGLSYSRKFGKFFAAGVQMDYIRIHIQDEYGNKNLVSCEIGLQYKASRDLVIGVQVLNPVPVKITENPQELLPTTLCAGLSCHFSEEFLATIEIEKDLLHKPIFRAGAEYHFATPVYARIGISTNPVAFSFGFGLKCEKLTIDMASGYHQALGFSPAASLSYAF